MLIQLAAERAATSSSVVVVTPHRLLVEQWVDRLQAVGTASRPLYTESDFFSLLPSDVPSEGLQEGVTIFSCSILRRPMPRTAIGGSDIDLLIFDDVAASANSRLAETFSELIKRAKRTIVASTALEGISWFSPTEVDDWRSSDLPETMRSMRTIRIVYYSPGPGEVAVHNAATGLLSKITSLPPRIGSRPAFLAAVLGAAAMLGHSSGNETNRGADTPIQAIGPPGLEEALWETSEALEGLGPDGRLTAVTDVITSSPHKGAPVLITTDTVSEAAYVAEYLLEQEIPHVVVTGSESSSVRNQSLGMLNSGIVVIGTNFVYDALEQLPSRSVIVWWTAPGTLAEMQKRLGLARNSSDIEIFVILANPPWPSEREFATRFLEKAPDAGLSGRFGAGMID